MIHGGNATIFVSDLDRAIEFYVQRLGLLLRMRVGDDWAEIDAGGGLILGLNPGGRPGPQPGTPGAMQIGFAVQQPIETVVERLSERGVSFHGPIFEEPPVRMAFFADPDGNRHYLYQAG